LLKVLGRGAFATVWLAVDESSGKNVAIKIVNTADEFAREAFLNEGKRARVLNHQNIVNLLDIVVVGDSAAIVSEYVEGVSLASLLRPSGVELGGVLSILRAMGGALAAAHAVGFVHRDVKPHNILIPVLQGHPNLDLAKLTDFGVALRPDRAGLFRQGLYVGTPAYSPPEQILSPRQISPAADIYALGVVAYEMFYGRRPFESGNSDELYQMVISGRLFFPTSPEVPNDVRRLITRCLDRVPANRPTATEIVSFVESRYTSSRRPSATLRRASNVAIALGSIMVATVLIVASTFAMHSADSAATVEFLRAFAYAVAGISASYAFRRWARVQRGEIPEDTRALLSNSKWATDLTATLATQVDELVTRCKKIDEQIMVSTIAAMITEYDRAKESPNRQTALLNTVILLEKLMQRLSPWYVRYEKAIAAATAFTGIATGVATAIRGFVVAGKP
jgi:serine/threonine-protein kinase